VTSNIEQPTSSPEPTMAEQVTKLYDIIGGYHATNLLEIGRDLGVWTALTESPGITSPVLAMRLKTDTFYTDVLCRTALAFGIVDRKGAGWRMAPHFDQILGNPDSTFYLAHAPRVHMSVGGDYKDYPRYFRSGTGKAYQEHTESFMLDVAEALKALPRIFIDFVLPRLPDLAAKLKPGAELLDVGCGSGWAIVQLAQRFPGVHCVGIDIEPYSVAAARKLIIEHNLTDFCDARMESITRLDQPDSYDVVTSFLVVHEIAPKGKPAAFAAVAKALKPGGSFLIFDEAYPETDEDLRQMPKRFAALAQWYELTWGNRVNTRTELLELCAGAGLEVTEETDFSRFHIIVATRS
jgi:SAM-dependent methyltransferase